MAGEELKKGRIVSVWLNESVIERTDRLAERADLSRSKFLGQLMDCVTKEFELCTKLGIVQFSKLLDDFREAVKEWTHHCYENPQDVGESDAPREVYYNGRFVDIEDLANKVSSESGPSSKTQQTQQKQGKKGKKRRR